MRTSLIGRVAAIAAIAIAVVAVAVILFSGGSTYQVKAVFQDASQVVSGDQVEVAGNSVGSVSNITLTPEGQAQLTLQINESADEPLHQGTIATVRQLSLSGLANRYIDLRLGPASAPKIPNNGVINTQYTTSAVDLDQLFNSLDPQTRKGLQDVIQGSASEYAGQGQKIQAAWQYLNPAIASSSMLFREINRDTGKFTNFVVKSGNLVTDIAQRQADLSNLIQNLSITTSAIASQHTALGQSIQELPPFMRLANTTFVNLRNSLDALTPLVDASKPVVPKLQALFQQLRPLAQESVPTVRDLANVVCSPQHEAVGCANPGPANDLIELTRLGVPLAAVTCGNGGGSVSCHGTVRANGKNRLAAFPESVNSLNDSTPELAVDKPYAVDLTGWFEGFTHPGIVDANGGVSRIAPVFGVGSIENGAFNLIPQLITNPVLRSILAFGGNGGSSSSGGLLTTGQGDRCPGSIERGGVYYPYSGYPCNPNETPTGP